MILNENFTKEGFNQAQMLADVFKISDSTMCLDIEPENLIIYSIDRIRKEGFYIMEIDSKNMFTDILFPIKGGKPLYSQESEEYFFYYFDTMKKDGFTEELIMEIKNVGYYMKYNDLTIVPSEYLMTTLCRQIGCSKLPDMPDPIRELFIAHLLRDADNFKMIIRQEGGIAKALACFSDGYNYIPQKQVIEDLLKVVEDEEYLTVSVNYYKITQFKTQIRFEFPEMSKLIALGNKKKKVVPSIIFTMSDSGDYSYRLQSYIGINGQGVYVGESISLQHRGSTDIAVLVREYALKGLPILKEAIKDIEYVSSKTDETVDYKDVYIKILEDINFTSAIGVKLYNDLKKDIEDRVCTSKELLFELLDINGRINKLNLDERGKYPPESTMARSEKQLGEIFNSGVAKDVFGW